MQVILASFEHFEHIDCRVIIICDCGQQMRFIAPLPVSEKQVELTCLKCNKKHEIPIVLEKR